MWSTTVKLSSARRCLTGCRKKLKDTRKGKSATAGYGVSMFSTKIKCGTCGGWYGSKVWRSNDKYCRTIYRCNDKFKNYCQTPHLTEDETEDEIKGDFVRAVNQLIRNKEEVISNIRLLKTSLSDTSALEKMRSELNIELNWLTEKVQELIAENARAVKNQDEYSEKYNALVNRYETDKGKYDQTCEEIQKRKVRGRQMDSFISEFQGQDLITEFDEKLWGSLVDFITVYAKDDIRVTFKDGTEIKA